METLKRLSSLVRPSQQLKSGVVVLGVLASGKVNSIGAAMSITFLSLLWISLSG